MSREKDELVAIIDELAGTAASMTQGPQNYDTFIRARELCIRKINDSFVHREKLVKAINELHDLV